MKRFWNILSRAFAPIDRRLNWLTRESPLAKIPAVSWLVHGTLSVIGAVAFYHLLAWLFSVDFGWLIGTQAMAGFYLRKEIGDFERYRGLGTLFKSQRKGGATNIEDGVGDVYPSLMLALGTLVQWWVG